LKRYLEQGFLALDNNHSERTLRAIALGRNAWGVIGSEVGGKTDAVLFSVIGTCKHLRIDPLAYLRDALAGLFALGEEPAAEQLLDSLAAKGGSADQVCSVSFRSLPEIAHKWAVCPSRPLEPRQVR
jgi:hypothetical protein